MRALVTFHTNKIGSDFEKLEIKHAGVDGDFRIFSLNSGLFGFPPHAQAIGNFYYANWPGLFDEISIGPSVQLFKDAWGRAFLRHCVRNLSPGGVLRVPIRPAARVQEIGGWSQNDVSAFLKPQSVQANGVFASARSPNPPAAEESTLDWFVRGAAGHAIHEMVVHSNTAAAEFDLSDSLVARMDYTPDKRASTTEPPSTGTEDSSSEGSAPWAHAKTNILLEPELKKSLLAQSYYVGGISYKGPMLKHILRAHGLSGRGRPLSAIDFGGGYGLLMAELLLDPEASVARTVVSDISPLNRALAANMFRDLYEKINGRFFFDIGAVQDFSFRERFDVISFVGSLLYVPAAERYPTLQKCWEALNPGGVLVIHENIKAPSYTRDFDVMFTVDEIDNLLERFGEVKRYASKETRMLSKSDTASKTVFRVLQKG